jgi:hypothetical protein
MQEEQGMKLTRTWMVIALVIGTCAVLGARQSTAQTSMVVLELTLPNGAMPQLRIADGGMGAVELPKLGKFGFTPMIQPNAAIIQVDVFDLGKTPHEKLGRAEAVPGGDVVQSETKPAFGIRVVKVVTPEQP